MVTNYIRTGYRTQVRFAKGSPPVEVRFYRAPKKAKLFPGEHMGLTRDWFNYSPDIGEVGPRVYDKGANIRHTRGRCFRGKPEWFRDGVDFADLAGQVQVDHCTSCPGLGPRIGLRPPSSIDYYDWVHDAVTNVFFAPVRLLLTIAGSPGSDGTYESEAAAEIFSAWDFNVPGGFLPGPYRLTQPNPRPNPWQFIDTFSGTDAITRLAVDPGNPFVLNGVSTGAIFALGATLTFHAALVVPHYYSSSRLKLLLGGKRTVSKVGLVLAPSGTLSPGPSGPSGFSTGFSAGFGGP